jgi:tight adherence protein B
MITALVIAFALGVFLVFDAAVRRRRSGGAGGVRRADDRASQRARVADWLATAGLPTVTARQFVGACAGAALAAALLAAMIVGSPTVALIAMVGGGYAPVGYVKNRRRARRRAFLACWPDAIELLVGACRAGETLPGALAVVAERGPEPLRPAFRGVTTDHRVSGDLVGALERMSAALADPVSDRVAVTLTVAHRVGGRELVRVLRTLATFLREDAAIRAEIEARQSWTVVAARTAAAAPWLVLVLIASRPQALDAYNSLAGFVVLAGGALATLIGYRIMVAAGRLPEEPRVLAGSR